MATVSNTLAKLLYILQDENNPYGSNVDSVWPETTIDQVFDNLSSTKKTLREIIADIRQEIITGGTGNIVFPVTTVQGRRGDVVITKDDIGLNNVNNTSDMEKPLSENQRSSVQIMINNAVAEIESPTLPDGTKVNFQELVDHMINTNNPHGVTLNQINSRGEVNALVAQMITSHNNSGSAHNDIRDRLSSLEGDMESINDTVNGKMDEFQQVVDRHYTDPAAHSELFDAKEGIENKSNNFETINHIKYPTVKAVAEFVLAKLSEFGEELEENDQSIEDIAVEDRREDLPAPSVNNYRHVYFLRQGPNNTTEIAICRKLGEATYYWDYTTFTNHANFDPNYFYEGENGLTINTVTIAELILDDENILNHITNTVTQLVTESMGDYLSKEEFNTMENVRTITILPGTIHGSIRFYINDDQSTMSEDISVSGLKRLAYLDYVSDKELADAAVQTKHLEGRSVTREKIDDRAVNYSKMSASYETVIGNINDPSGTNTAEEITLYDLAVKIKEIIDTL